MLSTIALPNDTCRELADALLADLAAGKAAVYLDQPWGRMPALSEREHMWEVGCRAGMSVDELRLRLEGVAEDKIAEALAPAGPYLEVRP